jgi:hypothetical protein
MNGLIVVAMWAQFWATFWARQPSAQPSAEVVDLADWRREHPKRGGWAA